MLRTRLVARDGNVLQIVRKGKSLRFGEWAEFFLENYSKPPVRQPGTHNANLRCVQHLKRAFVNLRLIDVGPDEIELYLRERLRQRVKVRIGKGYRGTRPAKGHHGSPGTEGASANVERCGSKKAADVESMCDGGIPRCFERVVPSALCHLVRAAADRKQRDAAFADAIRIIVETGLRVKKELLPMKKDQIDFLNAVLWIPDSKTPNGVAEIPLTRIALEAFQAQIATSGNGEFLFPSDLNQEGHLRSLRTAWRKALKRTGIPYFSFTTCAPTVQHASVPGVWRTNGSSKCFVRATLKCLRNIRK